MATATSNGNSIVVERAKVVGCPWTWAIEHTQCVLEHLQALAKAAAEEDAAAAANNSSLAVPPSSARLLRSARSARAKPLDGDADCILLVANDGRTAFEVPRRAAHCQSTFLREVLDELAGEHEDGPDNAFGPINDALEAAAVAAGLNNNNAEQFGAGWKVSDAAMAMIDTLPGVITFRDCPEATPEALFLFATWLRHHDRALVSRLEVPTPSLVTLADVVDDPWDVAYLTTVVSPVDTVTEDLKDAKGALGALAFATLLGAEAWQSLLASFVVFQLRRSIRLAATPAAVLQRWLKRAEPLSFADAQAADRLASAVMATDEPRRTARPVDADQW
eukprot:CAMPEP_0174838592 /NCGR_PEP_ID=MMETSP1114-20130205/7493_1 /TAXON_ID=312471 /ORGANISM="Neobodo designis, Strain CCAP 1951/1" /LENGTH=333 /DNA_ID=CAMNT_0016072693 /DNA_START=42 /DNA_END=1040 /DNA_ORIENTATION=-